MTYNLSHLYRTETVDIGPFAVTVREIPHGEFVKLQKSMLGTISLSGDQSSIQRQLESKKLDGAEFADQQAMLGIDSWTLVDLKGEAVPVCLEAWRALPHHITERIEEAINRLNPDVDDDFQSESGSESES